jgi:hypothetical protein
MRLGRGNGQCPPKTAIASKRCPSSADSLPRAGRPSGPSREDIQTLDSYVLPRIVVLPGSNDLRQVGPARRYADGSTERHSRGLR